MVEEVGMIDTIYLKAKISQAKSAGNQDDLLKRINPRSGSKEPLSTKWALNPKGRFFELSLGLIVASNLGIAINPRSAPVSEFVTYETDISEGSFWPNPVEVIFRLSRMKWKEMPFSG
jgi:hypothetical protein